MAVDPFLEEIKRRLGGTLNPELFEECVTDLLKPVYPTIVHARGGRDSGRDGILAGDREPADFLVCTTGADARRNLRSNLDSHKLHGKQGNRVIFATSKPLTVPERDCLEQITTEKGYALVQTYDQANLAKLLYQSPAWCRRLLNLPGEPDALSKIPKTSRPLIDTALIGRDEELSLLTTSTGDLVLVGQPGIGKTSLLFKHAKTSTSFFAVSRDAGRVVEEIRQKQPSAVILDDASGSLDLLHDLVHFRQSVGTTFRIIATCWPAQRQAISQALYSQPQQHEVQRLTRDQIVEVVKACGISGPSEFIREIVDQADGRPGLAVTLCHICLAGNARSIVLGDALAADTRKTIETLGKEAYPLLGCIALSGNAGMKIEEVATALNLSNAAAFALASEMCASGILHQHPSGRLVVRPQTLQHALVRDVFFSASAKLDCRRILETIPDVREATIALAGARARGGSVSLELMFEMTDRTEPLLVLPYIARMGPDEATAVFDRYPDYVSELSASMLTTIPEKVLPFLFKRAIGDNRPLHSTQNHPLRIIQDWVRSGRSATGEAVKRRTTLHHVATTWLRSGGESQSTIRALIMALDPKYEDHDIDPGAGRIITFTRGSISSADIQSIISLWHPTVAALREVGQWSWQDIQQVVWTWCYPSNLAYKIPDEFSAQLRAQGIVMLKDLIPIAVGRPGIQQRLLTLAAELDEVIEIPIEPAFLLMYPIERLFNVEEAERQAALTRSLGPEWSMESASTVVPRMIRYFQEAEDAGINYPRNDGVLWQELSQHVHDPLAWAQLIVDQHGPPDMVAPFLQEASKQSAPGWLESAKVYLEGPYSLVAAHTLLCDPACPNDLIAAAANAIVKVGGHVWHFTALGLYSTAAIKHLLQHANRLLAGECAIGLWRMSSSPRVPLEWITAWKQAIIDGVESDHSLVDILQSDENLADAWLRARVKDGSSILWSPRTPVLEAVQVLSVPQRVALLKDLDLENWSLQGLIRVLAQSDPIVLRALLSNAEKKHAALTALQGIPDSAWSERALIALDAGHTALEIVNASFSCDKSWSGNESSMWSTWISAYQEIGALENPRLHEIVRLGIERSSNSRDRALREEKHADVYGF